MRCDGEETYVVAEEHGVEELYAAYQDQEGHEGVEEECAGGRSLEVFVPHVHGDFLGRGFGGKGGRWF
jgi:hypothetical protein